MHSRVSPVSRSFQGKEKDSLLDQTEKATTEWHKRLQFVLPVRFCCADTTGVSPIAQWSGTQQQGFGLFINSDVATLEFNTGQSQPGFQVVYFPSDLGKDYT